MPFARTSILLALLAVLVSPCGTTAQDQIRSAVFAGRFYPGDAETLRDTIRSLVEQAHCDAPEPVQGRKLRALILPHAGYAYSGAIAAKAHCVLTDTRFDKVILMGPDHQVGFGGGAVSDVDAYATPLGRIALHPDAVGLRQRSALFTANPLSDSREHCLEVILPFLQFTLPDFRLVPIVLGPADHFRVAAALQPHIDDRTLVVVSADLSHYLTYDQAVRRDTATIAAIVTGDTTLLAEPNRTCGIHPITVLLHLARAMDWKAFLLGYANSGDTAGDRNRVVGYAAIAFFTNGEEDMPQPSSTISPDQGDALLKLARNTLMTHFGRRLPEDPTDALERRLAEGALQKVCGTFVTLTKDGQLRGCIGSLEGREPLAAGVATQAINAAFNDPRFPPLKESELDRVVIEVSVLTRPQPLDYSDADDLIRKLRPGIDGVTISKGFRGATFLPQVWEQLPTTEAFLSHLCMKAGLDSRAWRSGDLKVETYQVQYFEEPH